MKKKVRKRHACHYDAEDVSVYVYVHMPDFLRPNAAFGLTLHQNVKHSRKPGNRFPAVFLPLKEAIAYECSLHCSRRTDANVE